MNFILVSIYAALLFFVFSPSVLVSLPPKGSVYVVAATHALLFGFLFFLTARYMLEIEGFKASTYGHVSNRRNDATKKV